VHIIDSYREISAAAGSSRESYHLVEIISSSSGPSNCAGRWLILFGFSD